MGMTNQLIIEGKEGLSFVWGHSRKMAGYLERGFRRATRADLISGQLVVGDLLLFVEPSVKVEAPQQEAIPVEKTKRPKVKHVEGFVLHWANAEEVGKKLDKGYHIVAVNELVGDTTGSIDAVVHEGHVLLAKPKGAK